MIGRNTLQTIAIAAALIPSAIVAAAGPSFAQSTNLQTHRSGFGHANEVNARQGNQQSRISSGVRGGGITPGGERNLESRENSIHSEAQSERAANGGRLTAAEKQQINNRQNRVSRSIYNDRHNGIDDSTAAARNGTTPGQEKAAAEYEHQQTRPRGPTQQPPR